MAQGPLTPKQQRFVDEWVVDRNGTQAAIRAGYSPKTAEVQACRLFRDARVKAACDAATAAQAQRTQITADSVLRRLDEVANRCMQAVPVMEFDRAEREMVQATDEEGRGVFQFDSGGACRALELLGKHLALFKERLEISGSGVVHVTTGVPASPEKVAK